MRKVVAQITIFSDEPMSIIEGFAHYDEIFSTVIESDDEVSDSDLDEWYMKEYGEPYFNPIDWE